MRVQELIYLAALSYKGIELQQGDNTTSELLCKTALQVSDCELIISPVVLVTKTALTSEQKDDGRVCVTSVGAVCRRQAQAAVQVAQGRQQALRVARLQPPCYDAH